MAKNEKSITEQLSDMKKSIDDATVEKARLEGSLADKMKRLKELGFDTTAAAYKRLEELRKQIADTDSKVNDGIEELHKEYAL